MELLLMVYNHTSYAVDMTHVSRILDMEKTRPPEDTWLWNPADTASPAPAEMGVLLKNDYVLPADKVEKMITYNGHMETPNHFLKGCMKNDNIQGFILVKNRIYGMLSAAFLRTANIKE
jgi:hypothetical protein